MTLAAHRAGRLHWQDVHRLLRGRPMASILRHIRRYVMGVRAIPAVLMVESARDRSKIDRDVARWVEVLGLPTAWSARQQLIHLLSVYPEFRNLLSYRLRGENLVMRALTFRLLEPIDSLSFDVDEIGGGLFVQHGFATIVSAERIGADCWINQQVTVGHVYDRGRPVIGDRVTIAAGAVVIGPVTIGDDVTIGANTTVVKDVPAGSVVVGAAPRVLTPSLATVTDISAASG
jgi:serine O-acetyltransferase